MAALRKVFLVRARKIIYHDRLTEKRCFFTYRLNEFKKNNSSNNSNNTSTNKINKITDCNNTNIQKLRITLVTLTIKNNKKTTTRKTNCPENGHGFVY